MTGISQGAEDIGFQSTLQTTQCTYCTSSGLLATAACRAAGCSKTGTFVLGDEPTTYCDRHIYSNGNLILNYQRTGAAAKARIHGEVSYIPKKVEKKKEEPKQDQTKKPEEEAPEETEEEPKDDEEEQGDENTDEEKKQDEEKKDNDKKHAEGEGENTPDTDAAE